jgi:acyl-homoserine lactone acylase PvdQ
MLFINPHLSFFGPGQVYEGHVNSKESGWNFTGYTRLGFPFPYVGHNESLGWVSTDNAGDQADLYVITTDSAQTRYRYGNGYRPIISWAETLLVKSDVALDRRTVTFRKTHQGPSRHTRRQAAAEDGQLAADGWLEVVRHDTRVRQQAEARDAALNMLFGSVMAADAGGSTWYLYNGAVPVRDPRFDWSGPVDAAIRRPSGRATTIDRPPNRQSGDRVDAELQHHAFLLTSSGNPDSTKFRATWSGRRQLPRLVSRRISRRRLATWTTGRAPRLTPMSSPRIRCCLGCCVIRAPPPTPHEQR